MAGIWTRVSGASRSATAVQLLTETPVDGTEGVSLEVVTSVVPILHAPGGQTFAGTGRLLGYAWTGTQWVRSTAADIDMAAASGLADWSPGALVVDSPRGRFQLIPSGVGLSGAGTTITTEYLCTTAGAASSTAFAA